MNKLNLYVVRDSLAGTNELVLTAKNDEILKRNIKGVLMSQNQNFINTDTKDKDIFKVASLDTDTGVVVGEVAPIFVFNVEQVRLDLVEDIKRQKAQAGFNDEANN